MEDNYLGQDPGMLLSQVVGFLEKDKPQTLVEKTSISGLVTGDGALLESQTDNLIYKAGYYGYNASGNSGLFVSDENGTPIFSPFANAQIGLTFGLFTASAHYAVGDEVSLDAGLNVFTGGANTSITAGLIDEDGRLNPNARFSGDLELTLISGEVKGTVDVGGVGLTGSVEGGIGMGAQVDVGYKDGVISMDLGASVGVGGSVSLEVDLSDVIDTVLDVGEVVADGCQAIWESLFG